MNMNRRKRIEEIVNSFSDAKEKLGEILKEERAYYDNMPEGLQSSEKGEASVFVIEKLSEIINALENAMDTLLP